MKAIRETVRITDALKDDRKTIHIPGVGAQCTNTICGWVDVSHEMLDASKNPPNCKTCLAIVDEIKSLKLQDESKL